MERLKAPLALPDHVQCKLRSLPEGSQLLRITTKASDKKGQPGFASGIASGIASVADSSLRGSGLCSFISGPPGHVNLKGKRKS